LPEQPDNLHGASTTTVAHIARPIIEYIHEHQMDAVIGADRGGRLPGLAVHYGWRHQYPDERFPTADHRVHFVRNSSSVDYDLVIRAIDFTLERALKGSGKPAEEQKVLFLDDWVMGGSTFRRFATAAVQRGIKYENMHAATMNGSQLFACDCPECRNGQVGHHIVASKGARGSDWDGDERILGIQFHEDGITPIPLRIGRHGSLHERRAMHEHIDDYYAMYSRALSRAKRLNSIRINTEKRRAPIADTLSRLCSRLVKGPDVQKTTKEELVESC
jgi:hypothetical protein